MELAKTEPQTPEPFPLPAASLPAVTHEVYTEKQLAQLARQLGRVSSQRRIPTSLSFFRKLREIERGVLASRSILQQLVREPESVTPDVEWLLDNFHIIRETLTEVRTDLPPGYYARLPAQDHGPLKGWPRVFELASSLVSHTDGVVNEPSIRGFVESYQEASPLTIGELWAVPTMIRIALLEALHVLADRIVRTRLDHARAESWVRHRGREPLGDVLPSDAFILGLSQAARDAGDANLLERIAEWLQQHGADNEEAQRRERHRHASDQVFIGNCVTSLRLLNAIDWSEFFEQTSTIEAALRTDPSGFYPQQDFATRDACRRAVEKLARGSVWSETDVVKLALAEARKAEEQRPHGLVSYYLLDEGFKELGALIRYRPQWRDARLQWMHAHPNIVYFGTLSLCFAAPLLFAFTLLPSLSIWAMIGVALAAAIPLSEIAVGLLNTLICQLLPPRVLPKLGYRDGIPVESRTFVVIPALLTKPEAIHSLLERLELHHLANPDPNLSFALLTDFADAATEKTEQDANLLRLAQEGTQALNERYVGKGDPRFFFFNRRRSTTPRSKSGWAGSESAASSKSLPGCSAARPTPVSRSVPRNRPSWRIIAT